VDDHKDDVNTCLNIGTIGMMIVVLIYGSLLVGAWLVLK
jgi:hypothetical protein